MIKANYQLVLLMRNCCCARKDAQLDYSVWECLCFHWPWTELKTASLWLAVKASSFASKRSNGLYLGEKQNPNVFICQGGGLD